MTYEEALAYVRNGGVKPSLDCSCLICVAIRAGGGISLTSGDVIEKEIYAPKTSAPTGIDATLQDRGKTYGNFFSQSAIALKIKQAMATSPNWLTLESDQREALDMIAVKIARILNGDPRHHDSWHDISGYAKLVADRLTP